MLSCRNIKTHTAAARSPLRGQFGGALSFSGYKMNGLLVFETGAPFMFLRRAPRFAQVMTLGAQGLDMFFESGVVKKARKRMRKWRQTGPRMPRNGQEFSIGPRSGPMLNIWPLRVILGPIWRYFLIYLRAFLTTPLSKNIAQGLGVLNIWFLFFINIQAIKPFDPTYKNLSVSLFFTK